MKHSITYSNGITQVKNLVDQEIYNDFILSITSTEEEPVTEKVIAKLTKAFKKEHSEEFFTTESPLAKAIDSGLLIMPESQGGTKKCIVKVI